MADEGEPLKKSKSSSSKTRSASPTKASSSKSKDKEARRASSPSKKSSSSEGKKKDKLDSFLDAKNASGSTKKDSDEVSRGAHSTMSREAKPKKVSKKSSSMSVTPELLDSPTRKKKTLLSSMSVSSPGVAPASPRSSKHTRKKDKLDLFLETKEDEGDLKISSTHKKSKKKKSSSAASVDGGLEFLAGQGSSSEDFKFDKDAPKRRSTRKKSVDTIGSASSYGDASEISSSSHERGEGGEKKKSRSTHRRSTTKATDGKEELKRMPSTIQEERGGAAVVGASPKPEHKKKKVPKSPSARKSSRKGSVSSTVSSHSQSEDSQPEPPKQPRMMRRMSNLAGAPLAITTAPDTAKAKKPKKKKSKKEKEQEEEQSIVTAPKKPMGRRGSLLIAGLPTAPANQRSASGFSKMEQVAGMPSMRKAVVVSDDIFTNYLWTQQEEYPREWIESNRKQLQASLKDNPLHKALASRAISQG